jgi:hypothetical protein
MFVVTFNFCPRYFLFKNFYCHFLFLLNGTCLKKIVTLKKMYHCPLIRQDFNDLHKYENL